LRSASGALGGTITEAAGALAADPTPMVDQGERSRRP
jgi:hypothetical protein